MTEHEYEREADAAERELADMEERSGKVGDQIEEARKDWEAKVADPAVPGAAGDPDRAEEGGRHPETAYPAKGDDDGGEQPDEAVAGGDGQAADEGEPGQAEAEAGEARDETDEPDEDTGEPTDEADEPTDEADDETAETDAADKDAGEADEEAGEADEDAGEADGEGDDDGEETGQDGDEGDDKSGDDESDA